jgi:hypothetical protein
MNERLRTSEIAPRFAPAAISLGASINASLKVCSASVRRGSDS